MQTLWKVTLRSGTVLSVWGISADCCKETVSQVFGRDAFVSAENTDINVADYVAANRHLLD